MCFTFPRQFALINFTVVIFSEKKTPENYVYVSLKTLEKKIRLQGSFHLENNEIITFKICCRPDFQDEYVLIFAGMFLRVLLLFRTIFKWFAFFTYLIWIKVFTVVLQLTLFLSLKAKNFGQVDICLNKDMVLDIWYQWCFI